MFMVFDTFRLLSLLLFINRGYYLFLWRTNESSHLFLSFIIPFILGSLFMLIISKVLCTNHLFTTRMQKLILILQSHLTQFSSVAKNRVFLFSCPGVPIQGSRVAMLRGRTAARCGNCGRWWGNGGMEIKERDA